MPLDYCCQVQGCESKGVKDRTSWSKRGVAKHPQNWQKIFILIRDSFLNLDLVIQQKLQRHPCNLWELYGLEFKN